MSRPITQLELRAIRRLLKSGARHIEIARELDLSVTTIERIASDRLLRYRREVPDDELPEDDPPPGYHASNLRRCFTCGAMVYLWPCLTCRMLAAPSLSPGAHAGFAPRDDEEARRVGEGRELLPTRS